MLGRNSLFLILGVLALFVFAGCIEVGGAPADAIAVWQHQDSDGTWDIWYSLWDHTAKKWHVPTGEAEPIAVDSGDDHDPDVSSTADVALAVWSKDSANSKTIYYSRWRDYVWSIPSSISTMGKDTDPTVAMSYSGDAMAVWVYDKKELYYSMYNSATGTWTTPKKIDTPGIDTVSLPEITYSEYWNTYFLIFTGLENGTQYSYEMYYWGGWQGPWWIDYDAVIDNNQPTDQRTGISGDRNSGYVSYVWPVTDGTLESYSYMYDFVTYTFNLYGSKMMPDTAYDASDIAHGVHTKNSDLYHQPNVNSPATENLVSGLATNDYRGALTFILDRTVGLTVWWNTEDGSGEIYSAYYENGVWSTPKSIVTNHLAGYDRNPAVTPLQAILFYYEEQPYCGDGVLQAPPEECEVGIPCPNPNEICWIDCLCYDYEYPYCGDGILDPGEQCEVGIPCPNPNDICWWDCKCYPWPGVPPRTPPEPPPEETPGEPEEPGEGEPKPEPPSAVSCSANSDGIEAAGINSFDPTRMVCSDDCAEGYVCEASSCFCIRNVTITPRCGDGYVSTPNTPGGGTEECDTGSSTDPKPDTCSHPKVCVNCKCVGSGDSVSCTGNTLGVDRTDLNKFNKDTMTCTDDCSLLYGENYECNIGSCTCTPKAPPEEEEEEEEEEEGEPECGNGKVETGENCEYSSQCPAGYVCESCRCVREDQGCTDDGDCSSGYRCCPDTHVCVPEEAYCGNGIREGTEQCDGSDMQDCGEDDACSEACVCVSPPSLDCKSICGLMNLPIILGHGYPNSESCGYAAQEDKEECFTKCILYGFERVDNIAGWDSCCCKKVEMFPCEGCPGEDPYCPECPPEYGD